MTERTAGSDFTVVVPVYNEEDAVRRVLEDLRSEFPDTPIIVVDDGSEDATPAILDDVRRSLNIQVITHGRNRGYGSAIKTGIGAAGTRYVLTFDADGQHDPKDVSKLVEKAGSADMVVGVRKGGGTPLSRVPGKWLLHRIANRLAGTRLPDLNCGLRLFRKDVISKYLHLLSDGFSFSTTSTLALLKDSRSISWVEVESRPRQGKSSVRQIAHGSQTLLLILRVIVLFDPLRIFLPISAGLLGLGVASSCWNIATNPAGLADADLLLLISGLLVFLFGLVSDQIAELRRRGG